MYYRIDLDGRSLIFAENRNCAPEMASFQRALHLAHPSIRVHFSSSAYYSIPLVQAGLGIIILPDFFYVKSRRIFDQLISVPFDTDLSVKFGILYHKKQG